MSQVFNEGTNLAVAPETTLGTIAAASWVGLQPNSYGDVGPSLKKVARTPISKNRQAQKPILVDLDSAVPFQADVTKDILDLFMSAMFCGAIKHNGGTGLSLFRPTAVTSTGYTVAALGALPNNVLIYARGFTTAANNGLKVCAGTSVTLEIKCASLTAEAAPPSNATVDVVGVQGSSGDITMDASGNLLSTALDWTTLGLVVGQWIRLGDLPSGAAFCFANTVYVGFARIKIIAATKLTLEHRSWTVGSLDAGTSKTIRVFFSRYCRNVAYDHPDFLKSSFSFEITYPDLSSVGVAEYEYMLGNVLDAFVFNIPLTDKATCDLSFVGTSSNDPTITRATGGSTALAPLTQVAVSTATDLARLRVSNTDETGITTDFKNIKLTFKNNATPEKVLGTLGASRVNVGRFECMVEADVLFTSDDVVKAIRDNREVYMDVGIRNGDFGAMLDVMSMTLDEGDRNFPTNQSVTIKTKATGFQNPTLGSTAGMTIFGYLPAS